MKKNVFMFALCIVFVVSLAMGLITPGFAADPPMDDFYTIGEMNKASLVMLVEAGVVPKDLAATIAKSIKQVIAEGNQPGAPRPSDYLVIEKSLMKVGGPDVTRVHSGRSRQDMLSTTNRMFLRQSLLDTYDSLNSLRDKVLTLASKNVDTIVPAYTWGVQAQPTTFAHYLLALAAYLDRDAARYREAYARINLSPLGAAALGTTSFPINRDRLAELLGFDGLVVNSYDANHRSSVDSKTEFASVIAVSALAIGQFLEDLQTQYHDPKPWFYLSRGQLTGGSSIMPQKQNPTAIVRLRALASKVLGDAQSTFLLAHNVNTGMFDYRLPEQTLEAAQGAATMYKNCGAIVDGLVVDKERALHEVENDYSTMTEVANELQREKDVPFRIGHHFAAELTLYGREHDLRPVDIPYEEAKKIYKEATKGEELPMTEAEFKAAMSPQSMIAKSKGRGGPQPAEVERMLADGRKTLGDDVAWAKMQRSRLENASAKLQEAFNKLAEAGN